MNCVLTAASTVTRWRSIAAHSSAASNCGSSTHGAPSSVGVTCAVQIPKPNGAGSAEQEDVALGEVGGVDGEAVEVVPALLVVHHALRQPGRAGGRVEQEEVVDREAPLGERACRLDAPSGAGSSPARSRPR